MLIIICVLYISLFLSITFLRNKIDSDMIMIYQAKSTWNEIIYYMSTININWAQGRSLTEFKKKIKSFSNEVQELSEKTNSRRFYPTIIKNRVRAIHKVWNIVERKLDWIVSSIESPHFSHIILELERDPGLQQLNRLWIEMYYLGDEQEKVNAFILNEIVSEIESFPYYSETLNQLYDRIINEKSDFDFRIRHIQKLFSLFFFTIFLAMILLFSLVSAKSISNPIINSISKLTRFMGTTIDKVESKHTKHKDELEQLSKAVSILISHYTKLSTVTKKLADGDIGNLIEPISQQDIVGNALKEVYHYLQEFAQVSSWIKEGQYGAEINVKSEKDVLAQTFNIMSNVISEKITTLRNVLDGIDEGVLVIDEDCFIVEANNNFLNLIRAEDVEALREQGKFFKIFQKDKDFIQHCFSEINTDEHFTEIANFKDAYIPVKVIAKRMPSIEGSKDKLILIVTDESWKMRIKRERTKLKAQATLAELKALKAQINPHFLFNTLNSIAQLSTTNPDVAVKVVEKLSDLFRYSLAATKKDFVTISEELAHIKKYIEIENMRYGNRMTINYEIDHELNDELFPPMLLQPIIENAIIYGEDEKGNIQLDITAKKNRDNLFISISDHGKIKIKPENIFHGDGTGLMNVNQRLKTLYGRELILQKNRSNGITVRMEVPLVYP